MKLFLIILILLISSCSIFQKELPPIEIGECLEYVKNDLKNESMNDIELIPFYKTVYIEEYSSYRYFRQKQIMKKIKQPIINEITSNIKQNKPFIDFENNRKKNYKKRKIYVNGDYAWCCYNTEVDLILDKYLVIKIQLEFGGYRYYFDLTDNCRFLDKIEWEF